MYLVSCSRTKHLLPSLLANIPHAVRLDTKKQIFAGGELSISLDFTQDAFVPNSAVTVLQNFSVDANSDLIELLLTLDVLQRHCKITELNVVIPYFAYARQDKANNSALGLKVVAKLLECFPISKLYTLDLHNPYTVGFFNFLVENISTTALFAKDIEQEYQLQDSVIISPDRGSAFRAKEVAEILSLEYLVMRKTRQLDNCKIELIGNVAGKHCIVIDDIVASGMTIGVASKVLLANGAKTVSVYTSHLLDSTVNIANLVNIDRVYNTNSLAAKFITKPSKILDIVPLIAARLS